MTQLKGSKVAQLKVNDCILSILYADTNNFMASRTLLNIKKKLEAMGLEITKKSVINNYFIFLKELHSPNLVLDPIKKKINFRTDNIYMDVVEQYQTVLKNNKVIMNKIFGEIQYRDDREIWADIRLPKDVENIKTCHKTEKVIGENGSGVKIYYKAGAKTLMSYAVDNSETPLIYMERVRDTYTFKAKEGIKFKTIKISIPVPKTTYEAQVTHKNGEHELDSKENYVIWKMVNTSLTEEGIAIQPLLLKEASDNRSVRIEFVIENYQHRICEVKKCEVVHSKDTAIWVKYFTQAQHYEIRQ